MCSACGLAFKSVSGFEKHRVGAFTGEHPNYGRRCLSPDELQAIGMEPNEKGKWRVPVPDSTRLAARFRER